MLFYTKHTTPLLLMQKGCCAKEKMREYMESTCLWERQMGVSGLPERASHCPDEAAVVK